MDRVTAFLKCPISRFAGGMYARHRYGHCYYVDAFDPILRALLRRPLRLMLM